jgi:hypothetical protein
MQKGMDVGRSLVHMAEDNFGLARSVTADAVMLFLNRMIVTKSSRVNDKWRESLEKMASEEKM